MWKRNDIQFPRLLAEINAAGLTRKQVSMLSRSMDLGASEIGELFERAESEWDEIKRIKTRNDQKENSKNRKKSLRMCPRRGGKDIRTEKNRGRISR